MEERELQIGVSKYHAVEFVQDMAHLHCIGLEEVAPCRHIEEQMLHGDRGAAAGYHGRLFGNLITLYLQGSTYLLSLLASDQLYLCNRSYGSQGLPTEALGVERKEIIG